MPQVFNSMKEAWSVLVGSMARESDSSEVETQTSKGVPEDCHEAPLEGATISVRLSGQEDSNDSKVEIDLDDLEDDHLRRLRTEDPFLYHSLRHNARCCRSCTAFGFNEAEEFDHIRAAAATSSSPSCQQRRSSMPAEVLARADIARAREGEEAMFKAKSSNSVVVRRKRRLSTEAHPDLVLGDLLGELHELHERQGLDDDGQDLMEIFARRR